METARERHVPHREPPPGSVAGNSLRALSLVGGYLLRSAVVICMLAAVAGAATCIVRSDEPATYGATAEFAIVPSPLLAAGQAADQVESVAALDRPIVNATVSELLQSGIVAQKAAKAIEHARSQI